MKILLCILLYSASIMFSHVANSHQLSTSYLNLQQAEVVNEQSKLTGHWQIQLADLEQKIPFDLNADGNITWHEITTKRTTIDKFVTASVSAATNNGQTCSLISNAPLKLDTYFNQPYVVIPLNVVCPAGSPITLSYNAFFDLDANHKAITTVNKQSRVFSAGNSSQTFDYMSSSYMATISQYVYQGILHIWMGPDHILFLIALLLTCVLVRKNKKWQGSDSKAAIFKHTAWIVTAFTLAHSITLTATAMNLLSPSSRWVELGIAISVLFAALNNIWPLILRLGWITFAFGLLHGMGFASVLGELGLSNDYQLLSVLAFNLGVEIGQLAILIVALPLLMLARNHLWYQKWLMPAGSLAIAAIAVQWSIERI